MKVHRIHLRNYKGVEDLEVELALDGVTIIEGPNEVGKTTIAEALSLVLEQPDSSSRSVVRDARPVHNDAGPWVEVELSTGPYRFVVEKRWLRSPMTHLRVLEPRAEEVTGRQGHERLRAILAETLDEQLFRALHHYQGVELQQAALGSSPSLAAALDAAATGQAVAGQKEASLLELVREEWLRYFTPGGKPIAERTAASKQVQALEQEVLATRAQLEELEGLAERHRDLTARLGQLREELERCDEALLEERARSELLQDRRLALLEAEKAHATASTEKEDARRRVQERAELREEVTSTERAAEEAEREAEKDRPALGAAREAVRAASERQGRARSALVEAAQQEKQARGVEEYRRRLISRDLWSERLANARAGRAGLEEARRVLAANLMDEERLAAIEEASLAITEAAAHLAASTGSLLVEALADVVVTGGAGARTLRPGESFEQAVEGELVLEVGELARLTVRGGAPERSLREALGEAERRFADLLREAGLPEDSTVVQCRLAAQQRREAIASEQRAEKLVKDSLRDLSLERLEAEVADDEAFIASFEEEHGASPDVPETLEAARSLREQAEARRAAAEEEADAAEAELAEARARHDALYKAGADRAAALGVARALQERASDTLRLARELEADEALDSALERCSVALEGAARRLAEAQAALAALDPGSVEARLENLEARARRLAAERGELETEIATVRTTLSVRGEEGLQDRLDALESRLEREARALERTERAAAAANLLWRRLVANREAAQRAYVAPFRAAVERLGRIVYGPSFSVEVDHSTLAVASRTLQGRTVAFDQLSTGAREQLCVMARLACAGIVAGRDGGGAPVIIDDALGWTDRGRLDRIGAAFRAASRNCQVVVLTCDPSRYDGIGDAVVRHLRPSAPA